MKLLPSNALVRHVPSTYPALYEKVGRHISIQLALMQHQAYVSALLSAGLNITFVDSDERLPDCVFIEDPAVLWETNALIARMPRDRSGEEFLVEKALALTHTINYLPEDAFLEGGDVFHTEGLTFVGVSSRTNQRGAEAVRDFMSKFGRRTIIVPVTKCLHLETGATYLGNQTILMAPDMFDVRYFESFRILFTDEHERGAANCLRIRDHVLIPASYPRTEEKLRNFAVEENLEVTVLNISEFEKGEGSLTCLSLIS